MESANASWSALRACQLPCGRLAGADTGVIAHAGDRVLVRTGADAYKVARVSRNPAVLLAPSTGRGRPTGHPMLGHARILDHDEEPAAERALRARHGLLRRVYARTVDSRLPTVYLEIGPRPAEVS